MPSDILVQIAVIAFAMACIGGLAWVFLMPRLDGSANAAKRVERISTRSAAAVAGGRERDGVKRKRQVEKRSRISSSAAARRKARPENGHPRRRSFVVGEEVLGHLRHHRGRGNGGSYIAGAPFAVTVACLFIFTLGFPRWLLKFLTARRERAFLNEFANSVDVIVRGVKAGLPLGDCLRMVAQVS
ncbi:MAG: hypothetical protein R3D43_11265 [Tepidamorphaceae bacterium]